MTRVTTLLRYPIKSHGRESLKHVALVAGEALPFDRQWGVAHEASKADGRDWAPCVNFSRVSKALKLMAVTCRYDPDRSVITLSHPDRPDLTFNPDGDPTDFIDWVMPLVPQDRALPQRIIKLAGRGFTDSDFPSVTLCNHASHRAVEQQIGQDLSIHRWRGNIWFEHNEAWTEFDWIGKDIRLGDAVLRVRERTDRCPSVTTNPDTGLRDIDTLKALDHWGHRDFSVRAEVVNGGEIRIGDRLEVL